MIDENSFLRENVTIETDPARQQSA